MLYNIVLHLYSIKLIYTMSREVRKISELRTLAQMRKSVDLPDDVFVAFQKESIDRRMSPKKLMEQVLVSFAEKNISYYKTKK